MLGPKGEPFPFVPLNVYSPVKLTGMDMACGEMKYPSAQ